MKIKELKAAKSKIAGKRKPSKVESNSSGKVAANRVSKRKRADSEVALASDDTLTITHTVQCTQKQTPNSERWVGCNCDVTGAIAVWQVRGVLQSYTLSQVNEQKMAGNATIAVISWRRDVLWVWREWKEVGEMLSNGIESLRLWLRWRLWREMMEW